MSRESQIPCANASFDEVKLRRHLHMNDNIDRLCDHCLAARAARRLAASASGGAAPTPPPLATPALPLLDGARGERLSSVAVPAPSAATRPPEACTARGSGSGTHAGFLSESQPP